MYKSVFGRSVDYDWAPGWVCGYIPGRIYNPSEVYGGFLKKRRLPATENCQIPATESVTCMKVDMECLSMAGHLGGFVVTFPIVRLMVFLLSK